jgi:hypothetical protein
MTDVHTLERARRLFDQRSWADSYSLLDTADRDRDQEGRRLELDAARRLFKQLNAEVCLARMAGRLDPATRPPAGSLGFQYSRSGGG